MYSGVAIYDTKKIGTAVACELGVEILNELGISITSAGYYEILDGGDHDIIEISFSELKEKIEKEEVTSFRIYSEVEKIRPWHACFGYMTDEFVGFNYIDIQYPSVDGELQNIKRILKSMSDKLSCSYGINYHEEEVTKVFFYATGDSLVNIYPYENSSLFKRECPSRKGLERYKKTMLRMVYPGNIINNYHLSITLKGITLKEWILSDVRHGSLEKLNDEMWLWSVEENELDSINKCLGEAGILISWKPQIIKERTRILPK
ncbi:hypothetical protein [Trabulsiella odontotermitis]|uniref:hypothetical protein n=1 Tax=Trabulsiella odontotermitis TaxID=379893 RepID=UPI0006BA4A0D|nr:hypothetical protein [Trabulsiella odontotermitis]